MRDRKLQFRNLNKWQSQSKTRLEKTITGLNEIANRYNQHCKFIISKRALLNIRKIIGKHILTARGESSVLGYVKRCVDLVGQ